MVVIYKQKMNMNKLIGIVLIVFLSSCYGQKKVTTENTLESNNGEGKFFSVEIVQYGKILPPENEVINLEKAPFEILVHFYKTQGIDVAFSWDNHYFDYPKTKNIYNCNNDNYSENCRFWSGKSGAEDRYNEEKDIYIGTYRNEFYWAYDNKDYWKSFNSIDSTTNDYVIGKIIVEKIYNLDKEYQINLGDNKEVPIERINHDIYCVFATGKKNEGMKYPKELQRQKVKLKFNEMASR